MTIGTPTTTFVNIQEREQNFSVLKKDNYWLNHVSPNNLVFVTRLLMQLKQLEISDKKVRHHHLLQAVLQNLEQRAGRLVAGVPTNPSHATLKLPRVEVINREQIEGITGHRIGKLWQQLLVQLFHQALRHCC